MSTVATGFCFVAHDEHAQELAILDGICEGIPELVGQTSHSLELSLMKAMSGVYVVKMINFFVWNHLDSDQSRIYP
jgi:hypothetical protein